eukprot:3710017-Karenia_brevis.AAC.1
MVPGKDVAGKLVVWNAHEYKIEKSMLAAALSDLQGDLRDAALSSSMLVILGADLNFNGRDSKRFAYKCGVQGNDITENRVHANAE